MLKVGIEQGFPTYGTRTPKGYAKQLLGGTRLCAPIPGNKYERAIISQNLQRNCGIEFFEWSSLSGVIWSY